MVTYVYLRPSTKKDKKWMVYVEGKTVHFGAQGMSDFTKHKDEARRDRYDQRHQKREDWKNLKSAGFWSKWLLWNKPTISGSKSDIRKRFNVCFKRGWPISKSKE